MTNNLNSSNETNSFLENLSAPERIKWASKSAGFKSLILTTSGGKKAPLLPHLVRKTLGKCPPIIFVDTTIYPAQTYAMIKYLKNEGFDIKKYQGDLNGFREIKQQYPAWLQKNSPDFDKAVKRIKLDPLSRAFQELLPEDKPAIWLRGISRHQSKNRANTPVIRQVNGLKQLHPIIDWTQNQINAYLNDLKLPTNQAHYDITKNKSSLECGIQNVGFDKQ